MGLSAAVLPFEGDLLDLALGAVFVVAGTVILGGYLLRGTIQLRRCVAVLRRETVPVASVASVAGQVEVAGTAREADGLVRAPFTDASCLVCEYEIRDGTGRYETTRLEGRVQTRFYVEDDTASVLVDPAGATCSFEPEETRVSDPDDVPASLRRFLDEHPEFDADARWWARDALQFVERRLDPGEDVHVYGIARYDPTVSRRAGTVNAIIEAPPSSGSSPLERLRSRITRPPYVISDARERVVVRRLVLSAAANFAVVAFVIAFAAYFGTGT